MSPVLSNAMTLRQLSTCSKACDSVASLHSRVCSFTELGTPWRRSAEPDLVSCGIFLGRLARSFDGFVSSTGEDPSGPLLYCQNPELSEAVRSPLLRTTTQKSRAGFPARLFEMINLTFNSLERTEVRFWVVAH